MAEIKRYEKMKDSGIDIIGEIPSNWNQRRLKFLCSIITGNQDTQDRNPNGKYPFYVRSPIVEKSDNYTYDGEGILIAGDGVGAGRVFHHAFGRYAIHQRVYCLNTFKDIVPRYLLYYLSNLFSMEMDKGTAQSTVPSVRLPMLQNFIICSPDLFEQQAIADYLDIRCSQIDEIIEEAKKSIEDYKVLKDAVIANTVLHGLDKNVLVKNTDEKWCPVIPTHWRFERGKYLFKETNIRSVDGSEELLTVSQYTGITPRSMKNVNMFEATSLVDYKICAIDNIVANTMWMWAGAVGVSQYHGVVSPSYNTYQQIKSDYNSRYLDYLLRTIPLVSEYKALSTGIRASRLRLYPYQFLSIRYPVPPMSEQKAIVEYLDHKVGDIVALISEKQSLIEELQAYKKSLIYEVVTGKRKVT